MVKAAIEGLRSKIIAVTLVVSLTPLLFLGVVIYRQFSTICQNRMVEHTAHVARIQAQNLDTMLRERASALQAVLAVSGPESLARADFLDRIVETLNRTTSHPGLLALTAMDGQGRVLASSARAEVPAETASEIARATVYGRTISDVAASKDGKPRFFLTLRGAGQAAGLYLRAGFVGDMLERPLRRARIDQVQDLYLLNRGGLFQTQPWFDGTLFLPAPLETSDFNEGDAAVQPVIRDGKTFYYAGAWLSECDWLLVVRQASCADRGQLTAARNTAIFAMVIGFSVILLVTLVQARVMVGRLGKAAEEANTLSAQLAQNEKLAAIGKMAAGVAHEINNPLAVIDAKAGWVKDFFAQRFTGAKGDLQRFLASIEAIEKAVTRATKITRNLLAYAGRLEPHREKANVNRVLDSTIDMLEQHARLHRIEIQTDLQETLPEVAGDESRLQQVFLNLFNNAIDAIGTDGLIEAVTRQEGEEVVIHISDDGHGISPEMQKHLFEPFFTTKEDVYGTGLGLATSHGIIKNMNGVIGVKSNPGEGTTMTIILPLAANKPPVNHMKT